MPTGYTADVANGKITTLTAFALRCARNFGALIEMRDESLDAPIPETFEPSSYQREALERAKAEVRRLSSLTVEAKRREHTEEIDRLIAEADASDRRSQMVVDRYQEMLAEVKAWRPPSPDHDGLRAFMIKQLEESIEFDGPLDPKYRPRWNPDIDRWFAEKVAKAKKDVAYYESEVRKEQERTEERNRWIKELRASLPSAEASR